MHEMSVAESMLEIIAEALGGRVRILSAEITLGPLSGINAESLRFCFTEAAGQLGFGEPSLIVNKIPAKARCQACGREYDLFAPYDLCPACGAFARRVEGGDDFTIDAVNVADGQDSGEPGRLAQAANPEDAI